jgi:hypothetical protein
MRAYDIEAVEEFGDELLARLRGIYSKQKLRHPAKDPDFLGARADYLRRYLKTMKAGNFLFFKDGRLIGYVPYLEKRGLILVYRMITLPIQLIDGDYSQVFKELLQKTLRGETTNTIFEFFSMDAHKDLEELALADHGCFNLSRLRKIHGDCVTIVNYDGRVGKEIRYYVRKSTDLGCYIDSKLSRESFTEYYDNCMYESRERKGIEISPFEGNPEGLYECFKKWVELDKGRMSFVKDKNDSIVSGIFVFYSDQVCIYYHSATSVEGLSKYAGYLNLNGAIEFCRQRGLIFDLFGAYRDCDDRNLQNLYMFKKKWGEELDTPEYVHYPLPIRIRMKTLGTLRKALSSITRTS